MGIATKTFVKTTSDVIIAEHRFADGREYALVNFPSTTSKLPGVAILRVVKHPPVDGRQKIDMLEIANSCGFKSEYPKYMFRCWQAFIRELDGDEHAVRCIELLPSDCA
jgi:hypothetical protein